MQVFTEMLMFEHWQRNMVSILMRLGHCYLTPSMAGVRIEYLPPYSPDLNPIEEAFSKIKALIRREGTRLQGARSPYYDLYRIVYEITPLDAAGWFIHGGYF